MSLFCRFGVIFLLDEAKPVVLATSKRSGCRELLYRTLSNPLFFPNPATPCMPYMPTLTPKTTPHRFSAVLWQSHSSCLGHGASRTSPTHPPTGGSAGSAERLGSSEESGSPPGRHAALAPARPGVGGAHAAAGPPQRRCTGGGEAAGREVK